MANIDVSIILINYNTEEFTRKCIESLYLYNQGFRFEIILIDNASETFDQAGLIALFPDVIIHRNEVNVGFAKANIQGINLSSGEYLLLLNNDTILTEDTILKCLNVLKSNPDIGAISPKILYPSGQVQHIVNAFPSIVNEGLELLRITKLMSPNQLARRYKGRYFDYNASGFVPWIWATFFMIPRRVLSKLPEGKLYDSFFMYYEDVMWCYQIQQAGFQIFYCADSSIIHYLSKSFGNNQYRKSIISLENEKIYLKKTRGRIYATFIFLVRGLLLISQRSSDLRRLGIQYLKRTIG